MSMVSYAQVSSYTFSQSTATYTEVGSGATALPLVKADTYISPAQTIGFTFVYDGVSYTGFTMSSNGFISFNTTGTSSLTTNNFSDANAASRPIIAPLWDDLDGATPTTAYAGYEVTGTAPNRVLTVEWRNWEWNWNSAAAVISFQVKLHETSNVIDFIYRQEAGTINAGSASIGIGSATGSGAGSYLNLTSVTTPAVSSATSVTTIATKPATGTVYTFTPPVPCAGTPSTGTALPAAFALCTGSLPGAISVQMSGISGLTYQWEESTDDFATAPVNAVGGTGATTTIYTPPAYDGVPKKYRLKITCTASGLFSYSTVSSVDSAASPITAASAITFASVTNNAMTINFTAGSGGRRYVVVNTENSFVDPSNGTTAPATAATLYAGSGEQVVYDGTGATVTITGLVCNTQYYARVYEYLRCGTTPAFEYFYNVTTSATNPVAQTTTQPMLAALPVFNNFVGFDGGNLSTVFPGWKESVGATTPTGTTAAWIGSVLLAVPTAKVNLWQGTKREWIISPMVNITESSVLNFKAAMTDFDSAAADPLGIAATDDTVDVMISVDGCSTTWESVYTFDASSTITHQLEDFSIPLDDYIGSSIQIAFRASEGTVDNLADYDFHIGAVKIRKVPTCPEPISLSVTSITDTTATVLFEPTISPALGYDYILTPTNVLPADNATISGTIAAGAEFGNLTGLTASTKYFVWIRGKCSSTDVGPWSDSVTFTTNCAGVATFLENFDSYTTTGVNVLPTCWRRTGSSMLSYVTTGGVAPGSPANRFFMSANGATQTEAFAVLPPVSNLQAGTHRLKFKAYSTVVDTYFDVGYLVDFNDVSTFNLIESILLPGTAANTAQEFSVAPTSIPAGITSLVFRNGGVGAGVASVYIDDVVWEVAPTCPDVVNISVSDVTSTSAYVEWEQTGGETGFQVVYGPSTITDPNDPSIAANITSATNTFATLSTLTAQTNYKLWVRSVCGASFGAWVGPVAFTTQCAALPVPYILDFESITVPALPACTTVQNIGTGNNWTTAANPAANGFNSKVLRYSWSTPSAANTWFYTQGIQLTANTSYTINYKYGNNSATFVEKLKVMYGTSPTADGMTEEIADYSQVTGGVAQSVAIAFTPGETGVYYFGFNAYSIADQFNLYVDDIKIDLTPTCIEPTGVLSYDVTNTQVSIEWTDSVTPPALGYQYAYSTTNTLPAVLDATNSGTVAAGITSATISGLTPSTIYYVWVRSLCSPTDNSIWTLSVSFKTQCNDVTAFSENFDSYTTTGAGILPNCWAKAGSAAASVNITTGGVAPGTAPNRLYMFASFTASTVAYAVLPNVSNLEAETHRLKFKAYATTAAKTLEVGYFADANDVESFVELQSYTLPSTAATTATQFINLPVGVPAGVKNLVFRNAPTAATSAIYIDDVVWEVAPTCPDVSGVTVSDVSVNTAVIGWTAGANETAWDVIWGPSTVTNPNDASIQPNLQSAVSGFTLTVPTGATTYNVWVRASCGADKGIWTNAVSFTTACDATDAPYSQNFESAVVPALPVCTSIQNAGTGNNWTVVSNPGYGFTTKALRYGWSVPNPANAWFFTRGINLTAGVTYTVSYRYGNASATTFPEKLKVMYGTSADAASMVNPVNDHPSVVGGVAQNGSAPITPDASGVYYFGFNAYSAADQFYLIVDDINIEEGLSNGENLTTTFKAFPNPVKDFLNLSSTKNITNVAVFNILGQQVATKKMNSNQDKIDMSNLATGTYLVKVTADNVVKTIKVIKQ